MPSLSTKRKLDELDCSLWSLGVIASDRQNNNEDSHCELSARRSWLDREGDLHDYGIGEAEHGYTWQTQNIAHHNSRI